MGVRPTSIGQRWRGTSGPVAANHVQNPSAQPSDADALKPTPFELALLLAGLLFGSAILAGYPDLAWIGNIVCPSILAFAMAFGNYRMAVQRVATILTPSFGFRTAILFYGGVGSLVPILGSDADLSVILSFYAFTEDQLLKYNMVITLFALVFTFTGPIIQFVSGRVRVTQGLVGERLNNLIEPSNFSLLTVGLALLILGTAVNFIFILPFQFGLVTTTFPVVIAQIAYSALIGIFLCTVWALQNRRSVAFIFVSIGLLYAFLGMSTFSKSDVIMPVIMLAAAFIYVRPNMRTLLLGALFVVGTFQIAQPITSYGRAMLLSSYGSITGPAGLAERAAIIAHYVENPSIAEEKEANYALIRFSYVNIGTLVIERYDMGFAADTLSYAYAVFIPRIIWPEKPILTDLSRELNYEITGNDQSAVATGLAPEGYWNGGWLGVFLAAFGAGTIFWAWSVYSLRVQSAGAWHLFPVVLLGIRAGTRFDGFFVVDILGPLLFAFIGHFLLMMANRFVHRFRNG